MPAVEAAAMPARIAEIAAGLLVTAAKARATRTVETEAVATRTEVMRVSRGQITPIAAAMQVGAVPATPTTTRTHGEEDAGEVVRIGSTAHPSSRK